MVITPKFQAHLADPIAALATARRFRNYASWTRKMEIDFIRGGDSDWSCVLNSPRNVRKKSKKNSKRKEEQRQNLNMHTTMIEMNW